MYIVEFISPTNVLFIVLIKLVLISLWFSLIMLLCNAKDEKMLKTTCCKQKYLLNSFILYHAF